MDDLTQHEVELLVAARDAFREDIDDDFSTSATRGYRHQYALSPHDDVNWQRLVDLGFLESEHDSNGEWYRSTDKCWETVFAMEHSSAK